MAVDETIKQVLWIRNLLKSLLGASLTIRLNCDSNPVGTHVHAGATILLRIADHPTIRAGLAVLAWIPPADQLANILTKPLPKTSFDLLAPKVPRATNWPCPLPLDSLTTLRVHHLIALRIY
ncbi:hypothetical protein PtB15_10B680 [Puccinia triticina]|nr:hypothetical protein PtB15_10B680 [Puccinia triticina]